MRLRHYQNINATLPFSLDFTDFHSNLKNSVSQISSSVLLGICLGVLVFIAIIVFICCRKYHNKKLYEQSPQNFSSKPNLSLPQRWISDQKIRSLTNEDQHQIVPRENYDGKFIQVTFKTHKNCIYFPVEQKSDCYFEIEIMQLSSVVQMGFVHVEDIDLICRQGVQDGNQIDFDQYGVSVRTDGTTVVYGNNQINFQWKIEYGDTLGIGLTKHDGVTRAWITRNGIIQNPPSQEERIKYVQVQNQGAVTVAKKADDDEDEDEEAMEQKLRVQALAAKRKIELKSRKFRYYAVLASETSPLMARKQTIINWNIGGQNFRLYDAKTFSGLLR